MFGALLGNQHHMMAQSSLQRAIELVTKATEEDNAGNLKAAFDLYTQGIDYFLHTLKFEAQGNRQKRTIREKLKTYMDRAEKIKEYLKSHPQEKRSKSLQTTCEDGHEKKMLQDKLPGAIVMEKLVICGSEASKEAPKDAANLRKKFPQLFTELPLFNRLARLSPKKMSTAAELPPKEVAKRHAAYSCAKKNVVNGCRLGVGSGSTVKYLVDYLEENTKSGKLHNIVCVPTSFMTKKWLLDAGLPVSDLEMTPELDVCIDGADEVDREFICIKGGGGCLAREKIVQNASSKFFIIADSSKESVNLGEHYNCIPIEVIPFAVQPVLKALPRLFGGSADLRMAQKKCGPVITDNNNYIVDWTFDKTKKYNWRELQLQLANIPGVVETGLFIDVVESVYFANPDGSVKEIQRK